MDIKINLTRRTRRRKMPDGRVVTYERHVLNFRDPATRQTAPALLRPQA